MKTEEIFKQGLAETGIELSVSQVMDMVVLDQVVIGRGGSVSPTPPDGNPGLKKIADIIVSDVVVGCPSQPNADPEPHETDQRQRRDDLHSPGAEL